MHSVMEGMMGQDSAVQGFLNMMNSQREVLDEVAEAMQAGAMKPSDYVRRALDVDELPIGPTPNEVVYTKENVRLLKYEPEERRYETPILFVYSLINRYYILDFLPGRSLIAYMLEQGYPVYCIDWGVPGRAEQELTWNDFLNRYIRRCVRRVLRDSGADELTLYGYCMGGTLALAYAALHPEGIRNFVAQATPVDFHEGGILSTWTRPEHFNVDAIVDAHGNVPPWLMEMAFQSMDPVGTYQKWEYFLQRLDDPGFITTFLAMEHWAGDNIPFPGEVYRQYIKDCYQTNNFMKGEMKVGGQRVDLSEIDCPLLIVVADKDTIAPPESSEVLAELVSSDDVSTFRFHCGHIGLSTSSRGRKQFWPKIAGWLDAHSDASGE